MTQDEARQQIISDWIMKAVEALESAGSGQDAGQLDCAVNGAHYACFYAATAVHSYIIGL